MQKAWRQPKPAEEPREALCTFKRQLVDFEDFKDSLQLLIISIDFFLKLQFVESYLLNIIHFVIFLKYFPQSA